MAVCIDCGKELNYINETIRLFFKMSFDNSFSVATVFALLLTATEAFSDDNLLFFSQDNGLSGAMGNSLFSGQSLASGSPISSFLNSDSPAIQSDSNSQTEIRVTKRKGQVAFNQPNLSGGVNNANINLGGPLAAGIVTQNGFGNEGSLIVNGEMANAALSQEGNRNHGYVDVSGVGASGIVTQKGDDNNTSLKVSGNGTTVILLQEGDNISSSLAVKSGGRTVTIKQTNP
jgi:hypothetical protein